MQQTAKELTIEQALNILYQVAAVYKGTLQDHEVIKLAFKVIEEKCLTNNTPVIHNNNK